MTWSEGFFLSLASPPSFMLGNKEARGFPSPPHPQQGGETGAAEGARAGGAAPLWGEAQNPSGGPALDGAGPKGGIPIPLAGTTTRASAPLLPNPWGKVRVRDRKGSKEGEGLFFF